MRAGERKPTVFRTPRNRNSCVRVCNCLRRTHTRIIRRTHRTHTQHACMCCVLYDFDVFVCGVGGGGGGGDASFPRLMSRREQYNTEHIYIHIRIQRVKCAREFSAFRERVHSIISTRNPFAYF